MYNVINNPVTTKEIQDLLAREICLTNELQNRSRELMTSVAASAQLHFKELDTFFTIKASKAEEELEIAHEQIKALEQELDDTKQELQNAFQMLDFISQEVNACYGISVETENRFIEAKSLFRSCLVQQRRLQPLLDTIKANHYPIER